MKIPRLKDVPISAKMFLAPGAVLGTLLLLAAFAFTGLQNGKHHIRDLSEAATVMWTRA